MTTIAPVNAASATSTNWLKEAQEALAASQNAGGMMGTLQNAKDVSGSISVYLARSQNTAAAMAQIAFSAQSSAATLTMQMADSAAQKRAEEKAAFNAKLNPPPQTNYNPPMKLDPVIYFDDGSSVDTTSSVMTLANGIQIDITTGLQVIDPGSIVNMANGSYLDTKNHILTLADGTKIDTVTGLKVTA